MSCPQLDELFKEVDTDGSLLIDFAEFVIFMLRLHHEKFIKKKAEKENGSYISQKPSRKSLNDFFRRSFGRMVSQQFQNVRAW